MRRIPPSLIEAATDLGASGLAAFRTVVLPQLATALLAGGILAFGLSFDELIVTTFTAATSRPSRSGCSISSAAHAPSRSPTSSL